MNSELKVFKVADGGGLYLFKFVRRGSEFHIAVDGGNTIISELLAQLTGNNDNPGKAIKKLSRHETVVEQVIYHYTSNTSEDRFLKWITKVKAVFEKYGTFHDPLIISRNFRNRMKSVTGTVSFPMTLRDHENHEERRQYEFNVTTKSVYGEGIPVKAMPSFLEHEDSPLALASIPSKFNYLSYEKGKVGFCDKMDFDIKHFELSRQTTKPSKVIRSVAEIDWIGVVVTLPSGTRQEFFNIGSFDHYVKDIGIEKLHESSVSHLLPLEDFKYLVEKARDRAMELLATELKPVNYNILQTRDIDKIYGIEKADKNTGILNNSCMAAHNRGQYTCAKQTGFFNDLNGVSIIYALNNQKQLLGRALVWRAFRRHKITKKFTVPITFVDRAYGTEDFAAAVREWATKKNYWWRSSSVAGSLTIRNKDGDEITEFITIETKLGLGEVSRHVPYFDTLKYFNVVSKSKNFARLQLSSFEMEDSQAMGGTNGGILVVKCKNCGYITVKKRIVSAVGETYDNSVHACVGCTIRYRNSMFIKSDEDVKLSFSSHGTPLMPRIEQAGRLVTVTIDGKEVKFDAADSNGIRQFFLKHTKQEPKPKNNSRHYRTGMRYGNPFAEVLADEGEW
jgi:hypothetical protein